MSDNSLLWKPSTYQTGDTCGRCRFYVQEKADRVCRRLPPQISFLVVPSDKIAGAFELRTYTGFPVMQPEQWCGMFERKPAVVA